MEQHIKHFIKAIILSLVLISILAIISIFISSVQVMNIKGINPTEIENIKEKPIQLNPNESYWLNISDIPKSSTLYWDWSTTNAFDNINFSMIIGESTILYSNTSHSDDDIPIFHSEVKLLWKNQNNRDIFLKIEKIDIFLDILSYEIFILLLIMGIMLPIITIYLYYKIPNNKVNKKRIRKLTYIIPLGSIPLIFIDTLIGLSVFFVLMIIAFYLFDIKKYDFKTQSGKKVSIILFIFTVFLAVNFGSNLVGLIQSDLSEKQTFQSTIETDENYMTKVNEKSPLILFINNFLPLIMILIIFYSSLLMFQKIFEIRREKI